MVVVLFLLIVAAVLALALVSLARDGQAPAALSFGLVLLVWYNLDDLSLGALALVAAVLGGTVAVLWPRTSGRARLGP